MPQPEWMKKQQGLGLPVRPIGGVATTTPWWLGGQLPEMLAGKTPEELAWWAGGLGQVGIGRQRGQEREATLALRGAPLTAQEQLTRGFESQQAARFMGQALGTTPSEGGLGGIKPVIPLTYEQATELQKKLGVGYYIEFDEVTGGWVVDRDPRYFAPPETARPLNAYEQFQLEQAQKAAQPKGPPSYYQWLTQGAPAGIAGGITGGAQPTAQYSALEGEPAPTPEPIPEEWPPPRGSPFNPYPVGGTPLPYTPAPAPAPAPSPTPTLKGGGEATPYGPGTYWGNDGFAYTYDELKGVIQIPGSYDPDRDEPYQQTQAWQQQQAAATQQWQSTQLAWWKQEQQAALEAQKQQQLASLRAQPASWLEYASLAGTTPAIQPWMLPLMSQQYQGATAGQALPGWQPGGASLAGLPELTTPSRQYQARVGPTAMAQYGGYQQARTGATPTETEFRLWSQSPPSGAFPGLRWNR